MVTYGFLSTFPPTRCGLATHSLALAQHLHDPELGERCGIIHVVDRVRPRPREDPTVFLINGRPWTAVKAIDALNAYDVAIVQHDFDVYGGPDGDEVLNVIEAVTSPVIAILHTVPADAAPHRREVLERIIDAVAAVVVLSATDAAILYDQYRVDADRVSVIPRGAAGVTPARPAGHRGDPTPPTILTWGLIGPGKGIEHAVAALAHLRDVDPLPHYLVCGQQDPRIGARQADAYADLLRHTAKQSGVTDLVTFDSAYRTAGALATLVRRADVVLLPYDARDRATSAVLTEAVAARRPVVATAFPHARDLLGDGAGLVVPHRDPVALARALRRVLTEPDLAHSMQTRSAELAPQLAWPGIAAAFRGVARNVLAAESATAQA
ncbi:glycosyltransferase [Actinospica sp.]|jgi:glycosyltransferase involved in cell wall biosynthesis|uniref:glycosyltransferase n=1 Tax=Actinospica sp. TaxID=1872142 RepID=UPI002CBA4E80|nr:glycosyltransferase [Actinospica sp.]HWG26929.1 glycosyltransferase [Actinospica sp.]